VSPLSLDSRFFPASFPICREEFFADIHPAVFNSWVSSSSTPKGRFLLSSIFTRRQQQLGGLFDAHFRPETPNRRCEIYLSMAAANTFVRVKKAWVDDFYGDALVCFNEELARAQSNFNLHSQYAKFLPVVQSSGMGKSRLIDQYATTTPGVVFTLRRDYQDGYPPGDVEVTGFLRTSSVNGEVSNEHAAIIALLSASISQGLFLFNRNHHWVQSSSTY
jgi:hypothetical protein